VGWIKNATAGRLNGSTRWDLTQLQKIIKAGYDTLTPGIGQINFDPFAQRSEPVTLPAAANARQPSILCRFAGDA